jgi:signal transduction histidine kinase
VPPGDYVFRVIARNRDGVWNTAGKGLQITVLAPYYRTWWFETLAALAAAALLSAAWRYRMSQLERARAAQEAFSRQLIASQEIERKRIAAELHDSLGQRLVVVKNLALFFLREHGEAADGDGKLSQIEEISAETSLAIDETRQIAYNLRPFQLDRLGLTKAIEGMIRTVSTASGIRFSTEIDNIDDVFPEELRINFYRIVQECLNNIVKHAHASEASVGIRRSEERVTLVIRDNGRGFTPGSVRPETGLGGFGRIGIAERARLLDGQLTVESAPGRGTAMRVHFDLRKKSSD